MYKTASSRAAKLEPRLSTLRIEVPADSRVGGLEILRNGELLDAAIWNQALPIDGGTYRISARAPDMAGWSTAIVVAAERDAKAVAVPRLGATKPAEPAEPARRAPTPEPGAERSRVAPAPPLDAGSARGEITLAPPVEGSNAVRAPGWTTRRKLAVASAGGGVIALAAGSVLGVLAKRKQTDAHAVCPDPQLACDAADRANELVRSGHNLAVGADVAFGVAAAAAIGAAILWLTGAPESLRGVAVVPSLAPGQFGITATGRL
jgi:hypothetical protein